MLQGLLQSELTDDSLATNIRVLHVLQSVHSDQGVERLALDTARALVEAKHESFICSSGGALVKEIEASGSSHIRIDLNTRNPIKIFLNGFVLAEIIAEYKIDLVHVYSKAPAWSLFFARRLISVPVVSVFYRIRRCSNFFKRFYDAVLLKFDVAIAPCKMVKKYIEEEYGKAVLEKVIVIEEGVSLEQYNLDGLTSRRIEAARSFLGAQYKRKKKTIMLSGVVAEGNGYDYFLDIIKYLPTEKFQFIVFDGKVRDICARNARAIKREGSDIIILDNYYQDMPAIYHLVDMVLDPSKKLGNFGSAIVEAQAMGCLVAVNRASGAATKVCNNETGFLLPQNSAKQAAEIIKEVFAMSPTRHKAIKQKAKDKIQADYDSSKQSRKVVDLYLGML
jgi:glycosyltransferase involved in cell wall biosynthesis